MTKDEAMKLALEALERMANEMTVGQRYTNEGQDLLDALFAIREALAEQPAQQQINCKHKRENNGVCPHHNLHCGWPKCNEPAQQQEPWPEEPEGHIAGGVQPSKQTRARWTERWYGSLAEKGWWICCGREHISHLGTEVSSDEVRKIVDAHNRTSPPASKPWVGLTDEEIGALLGPFPKYASDWGYGDFYQFARAIEAKLKEKNT